MRPQGEVVKVEFKEIDVMFQKLNALDHQTELKLKGIVEKLGLLDYRFPLSAEDSAEVQERSSQRGVPFYETMNAVHALASRVLWFPEWSSRKPATEVMREGGLTMATAPKARKKATVKAKRAKTQTTYEGKGGKLVHVPAHVEHLADGRTIQHKAYSYYQKPKAKSKSKK